MKVDEFAEDCHGANEDERGSKRPAKLMVQRTERLKQAHEDRRDAILWMNGGDARNLLRSLYDILWPEGDYEIEWTPDTIDEVANTILDGIDATD